MQNYIVIVDSNERLVNFLHDKQTFFIELAGKFMTRLYKRDYFKLA